MAKTEKLQDEFTDGRTLPSWHQRKVMYEHSCLYAGSAYFPLICQLRLFTKKAILRFGQFPISPT